MDQKDKTILWENIDLRRIFIIAAVSVILFSVTGFSLYQARAQFPVNGPASGGSYPFAAAASSSAKTGIEPYAYSPQMAPMLEIHIANNGLTLLRGAKVVSLSSDTLSVITAWDSANFTWEIRTDYFTKIFTSKGAKETLADVQVGDIITVSGQLIKGGAEPIIDAQFVRE